MCDARSRVAGWPVTAVRKGSRSTARSTASAMTRTVAARGTSRMRASSPKPSPRVELDEVGAVDRHLERATDDCEVLEVPVLLAATIDGAAQCTSSRRASRAIVSSAGPGSVPKSGVERSVGHLGDGHPCVAIGEHDARAEDCGVRRQRVSPGPPAPSARRTGAPRVAPVPHRPRASPSARFRRARRPGR